MSSKSQAEVVQVLPEHLALLRKMQVTWIPIEAEAPYPHPEMPYGSREIEADVMRILLAAGTNLNNDKAKALAFHEGALEALPVFLALGTLPIGRYTFELVLPETELMGNDWAKNQTGPNFRGELSLDIGENELKLLKRLLVGYVPQLADIPVNVKRPYGSSSNHHQDIAETIGERYRTDDGRAAQSTRLEAIHQSMLGVMQVFLMRARFEPNLYILSDDSEVWTKTTPEEAARQQELREAAKNTPKTERRTFLGVIPCNPVDQTADRLRLGASAGIPILKIDPGSPAEKMGIETDDVLLQIDELKTDTWIDVVKYVRGRPEGATISVLFERRGKVERRDGTLAAKDFEVPTLKPGAKLKVVYSDPSAGGK